MRVPLTILSVRVIRLIVGTRHAAAAAQRTLLQLDISVTAGRRCARELRFETGETHAQFGGGVFAASGGAFLGPVPEARDLLSAEVADLDEARFEAIEERAQVNEAGGQDAQTLDDLRAECHAPYIKGRVVGGFDSVEIYHLADGGYDDAVAKFQRAREAGASDDLPHTRHEKQCQDDFLAIRRLEPCHDGQG